nr:MAG TPA: hypothetical protein [Caudoviricetes sp.]
MYRNIPIKSSNFGDLKRRFVLNKVVYINIFDVLAMVS